MFQGVGIGNANALVYLGFQACGGKPGGNLGAGAVYQYQLHAQALEQGNIVNDVGEVFVLRHGAPQHQHEGLAPVHIDIGCGVPEPADVGPARRRHFLSQVID